MGRRQRNNSMKEMGSQIQRAQVLNRINLHLGISVKLQITKYETFLKVLRTWCINK